MIRSPVQTGQVYQHALFNTLRPSHNCRHFADDIFKCIFLNENARISLRLHWSLFLSFKSTIFRKWLGTDQATSHYLDQWWLVYWRIYASLGLNELTPCWSLWKIHFRLHYRLLYTVCIIWKEFLFALNFSEIKAAERIGWASHWVSEGVDGWASD